jgi:vacuolar-type H+-ATPase subunit I/STV1
MSKMNEKNVFSFMVNDVFNGLLRLIFTLLIFTKELKPGSPPKNLSDLCILFSQVPVSQQHERSLFLAAVKLYTKFFGSAKITTTLYGHEYG